MAVETSPAASSIADEDNKKSYTVDTDPEADSSTGTIFATAQIIDRAAERALCRKLDFHLLPVLAIMYLFNALDKGNLGNAKTAGLERDLGFKGNQYNIILSVFYVPYVLFAPILVSADRIFTYASWKPTISIRLGVLSYTTLRVCKRGFRCWGI